ncbi:ADP-forming succinate--CoA ligase subunit beta [Salsipaludibacter albus]|uniref:ADP-forming succinate--CoA ligase subunit beta n=1 Tax=Salsipaludibacter albus TaxID=2849650 RepID=UPI001EE45085|nr:ADP-forming succinate--CoA ligase subunit beta [Salsipaludibacter albus]MBY5162534.1 ADP-forming succinate--CoA ligase subunit beta [Salsipaludibacter albus]
MDLVEYQGKQLFGRNGVAVPPPGRVCTTVDEVAAAAEELGPVTVVKSQVKTGGRGKAGGVKVAPTPAEAVAAAESIFGLDIKGHTVNVIYVEPASDIAEEYYLSIMHDRVGKGYLVIASREGGVDIEEVNRTDPDAVVKQPLLPSETADGLPVDTARDIITRANFPAEVVDAAADLLVALFGAMVAEDATLVEINPLVRTTDDRVIALDSKVTLDANAAFRHDGYAEWEVEGLEASDPLEAKAKEEGIQYVKLDGSVGVLGNGAGLVMATLDVVAQAGGKAADFLDIGGGASADVMAESLALVLSDPQVKSVFVNVFGGITRGEDVANGILEACDRLGEFPQKLVVRLDGTNAEQGRAILTEAAHPSVVSAATMSEAAEKAVELAGA